MHEGGLQHSLREDLAHLFHACNGLKIEQFLGDCPTALHYGLPDTFGLSPQSTANLARWEMVVAKAIRLYEPRLTNVQVHITQDDSRHTAARIDIEAVVALGWHLCHVHFHVVHHDRPSRIADAA
ncbi:MAG TPA: type VI secretion system baseplate subunit TssE [Pseudoduganella sp.]